MSIVHSHPKERDKIQESLRQGQVAERAKRFRQAIRVYSAVIGITQRDEYDTESIQAYGYKIRLELGHSQVKNAYQSAMEMIVRFPISLIAIEWRCVVEWQLQELEDALISAYTAICYDMTQYKLIDMFLAIKDKLLAPKFHLHSSNNPEARTVTTTTTTTASASASASSRSSNKMTTTTTTSTGHDSQVLPKKKKSTHQSNRHIKQSNGVAGISKTIVNGTGTSSPAAGENGDHVVEFPDCYVHAVGIRTLPVMWELLRTVPKYLQDKLVAVQPHAKYQVLLMHDAKVNMRAMELAQQTPRVVNLVQELQLQEYVKEYYENTKHYLRDCQVIIARFVRRLEYYPVPNNEREVFIFDIDDTILCSYQYMKMKTNQFQKVAITSPDYLTFQYEPVINSIVLKFYTYLIWKGYQIIFLSERYERDLGCTRQYLIQHGFHHAKDRYILRHMTQQLQSVSVFKQSIRTQLVVKEKLTIIGTIGDQYADVTGLYTGLNIKLPNYMYTME